MEALLKYAEVAQREPIFTATWRETQPVTVSADVEDDEEEGGRGESQVSQEGVNRLVLYDCNVSCVKRLISKPFSFSFNPLLKDSPVLIISV